MHFRQVNPSLSRLFHQCIPSCNHTIPSRLWLAYSLKIAVKMLYLPDLSWDNNQNTYIIQLNCSINLPAVNEFYSYTNIWNIIISARDKNCCHTVYMCHWKSILHDLGNLHKYCCSCSLERLAGIMVGMPGITVLSCTSSAPHLLLRFFFRSDPPSPALPELLPQLCWPMNWKSNIYQGCQNITFLSKWSQLKLTKFGQGGTPKTSTTEVIKSSIQ